MPLRRHEERQSESVMGLFKADFYRFFAIGFGAGALLVLATIGIGGADEIAHGVVPSAVAAPAASQ
jgi:hypothetical protein